MNYDNKDPYTDLEEKKVKGVSFRGYLKRQVVV
jgi:hypothetical protein